MKRILGLFLLCFAYCNIAHALPTGYTQLEYIESTGTQYIDTGIAPSNNTGFTIDFQYTNSDTAEQIIIGSFNPNFLIDRYSNIFAYAYRTGQGLNERFTVSAESLVARHKISLNWKNDAKFTFDDITSNLSSASFTNSNPIYIFRVSGYSGLWVKGARVYSVKISNNNNVVRDMIPAKNSNGVVGMYDNVSNTFFTNAGSGTFVAGPEIGIASTSYVAGMHEAINTTKQNKLTSTGANPNVIVTGDANGIVSSFTANNGIVTVTRSAVTLPWGAENSANRAEVWID